MTYYDDLGVTSDATDAEIRKAYYRKIREHHPERDAAGYQRVNSAYETLRDESRRRSYDAELKHGGRLVELEAKANAFMEKESWKEAEQCFKEILVLDSERETARNRLALCLTYQGHHDQAVKMLEQVLRRAPDDTTYRMNLGHIWLQWAAKTDGNKDYLRNAHRCFVEVIERQSFHSDAWLMRARAELRLGMHDAAWTSAEKSVTADDKEDMGDFDAIFFMLELTILTDKPERTPGIIGRIKTLTGGNDDARQYAVGRILSLVNDLVEMNAWTPALQLQEAALQLDPGNEKIKGVRDSIATMVGAMREFDTLREDNAVPPILQAMVALWLAEANDQKIEAATKDNLHTNLATWIVSEPAACREAIAHIRRRYPNTAARFKETLTRILGIVPSAPSGSTPQTPAAAGNSGCILIPLLVLTMAVAATLMACAGP